MIIYIMHVDSLDTVVIVEVEAVDKKASYQISDDAAQNAKYVLGSKGFIYIGRTYKKTDVFLSLDEAMKYATHELEDRIVRTREKLARLQNSLTVLNQEHGK